MKWTENENKTLIALCNQNKTNEEIAKALHRGVSSIRHKKRELGLIKHKEKDSYRNKWTEKEIEFLKRSVDELTDMQIAFKLGRTINAVISKRKKLKLKKGKNLGFYLDKDAGTLAEALIKNGFLIIPTPRNNPFDLLITKPQEENKIAIEISRTRNYADSIIGKITRATIFAEKEGAYECIFVFSVPLKNRIKDIWEYINNLVKIKMTYLQVDFEKDWTEKVVAYLRGNS